jgi:GTP-binding protein HflX
MKAILVAVKLPSTDSADLESSLEELKRLVQTLGFEVIGTLIQKRGSISPSTALGSGKLKELAAWTGGTGEIPAPPRHKSKAAKKLELAEEAEALEADEAEAEAEEAGDDDPHGIFKHANENHEETEAFPAPTDTATHVVFDQELTPTQLANLQKATGAEILDRTGVIVEIFHRHAKTREAQLQVEIARLNYLAPRLRATGAGERQGGGIGAKGVGETAHELDRRRIRDRVAELQKELEVIRLGQDNRRVRRREQNRIALVGYTNAGKSSLMRALTGSEVLVADKLFATLDTTVRTMQPEVFPRVLVSDTVGFIKKLPHDLVASFRSTLDEAGDASLLLYVVDASDPTFRSQLEVTQTVLAEIEAADIPSKLILNKIDNVDITQVHLLKREFPDAIQISSRDPLDIKRVKKLILEFFEKDLREAEILIPYDDKSGAMGELRKIASVISEAYEEKGVLIKIKTYPEQLGRIQKMLEAKK